jgi:short-subunit dehydrogenase
VFVPGPAVSVHSATRAHLFSFSIALHDEFRRTDVRVSCLCPGPTRTAFFGRAGMKQGRLASGWPMRLMDAEDVTAAGYRAPKAGKRFVVPGLRNRMFSLAARVAPRSTATQFTRRIMQEVPGGPE